MPHDKKVNPRPFPGDGARDAAVRLAHSILEEGAYSNLKVSALLDRNDLSARDRQFAMALAQGTVTRLVQVDRILGRLSHRPMERMDPWTRTILRIGVFQLTFSPSIPAAAACHAMTALARHLLHEGTVALVNAILRSAARQPDLLDVMMGQETDPVRRFSLESALPIPLAETLALEIGMGEASALGQAWLLPPSLAIRVNRMRTTPERLSVRLEEEGVRSRPSAFHPDALLLEGLSSPVGKLPSFREGEWTVQGEGAMMAARILSPEPRQRVLDLCAAPGGKTGHLAELASDRGTILAADRSPERLRLVADQAGRLGLSSISLRLMDASAPAQDLADGFDRVLADVPCSGLGLLSGKPEIRHRFRPGDLPGLEALQAAILRTAADSTAPGGLLLYSTCTVLPSENREQVVQFLADRSDFRPEPFVERLPERLVARDPGLAEDARRGWIQLLPHRHGCEGFYLALFRRSAAARGGEGPDAGSL